jgi:hypothetical protein
MLLTIYSQSARLHLQPYTTSEYDGVGDGDLNGIVGLILLTRGARTSYKDASSEHVFRSEMSWSAEGFSVGHATVDIQILCLIEHSSYSMQHCDWSERLVPRNSFWEK